MQRVATVGLDLGKRWFHVYGVDVQGEKVVNRRLPRSRVASFFEDLPRCRVAMETCGGAHHWGRLLVSGLPITDGAVLTLIDGSRVGGLVD